MATFSPPTHEEPIRINEPPLSYYRLTYAPSVVKVSGVYTTVRTPSNDQFAGLTEGTDYFKGGRSYTVDSATADALRLAGYTVNLLGAWERDLGWSLTGEVLTTNPTSVAVTDAEWFQPTVATQAITVTAGASYTFSGRAYWAGVNGATPGLVDIFNGGTVLPDLTPGWTTFSHTWTAFASNQVIDLWSGRPSNTETGLVSDSLTQFTDLLLKRN